MGDALMSSIRPRPAPPITPRSASLWACLLVLGWPALAAAQGPPSIDKETPIRVGLPAGSQGVGRMRQGAWAPVYVPLKAHKEGNGQQQFKLVFDALDLEENPYRYTVPVPALGPAVNEVVIGYLRAPSQEFTVTLQTIDGKTIQGPIKHQRAPEADPLKPVFPLYVVVGGSNLNELKEAMKPEPRPGETADSADKYYARISKVHDMPDRWFGYDAADVVVLTTDKDDFMKELARSDAATRRKALAEWVRRGGKLVISVGRNHQLVNSLLASMPLPEADKMPLVPFAITGSVQRKSLPNVGAWATPPAPPLGEGKPGGVEVATLARGDERPKERGLGDGTHVLLVEEKSADGKDPERRPIIVSSSCGLGRVVLVAFDLDSPPFSDWGDPKNPYQKAFFVHLRDEVSPKVFDAERLRADINFTGRDRPELLEALQRQIDSFEDVPVISFGWVALFILVYILIVGPLDYFVLKKVFKRLELTWVTFPTVVLTISVGAYFIAYALKGDDLRVNKIDLVEIDLHTPQAYGTSWFSVFSPRVQNYTLAVEPTFGGGPPSSAVALMENPLATPRGSASIFRQPYEYAEDAAGIDNVPIPVWSTRSFAASWRTPLAADKLPVRAELVWRDNGVTGKIENNLPVDLEDVSLIYRGRWYRLSKEVKEGKLVKEGGFVDVTNLKMGAPTEGQQLESWFTDAILAPKVKAVAGSRRSDWKYTPPVPQETSDKMMKALMFYRESSPSTNAWNSGLRLLNQSWRLESRPTLFEPVPYRDEVILVARAAAPPPNTPGHEINDKGLARLWNDKLPGKADQCPPLSGFLSQETYVRVYIPVK
jgi:hypothetical protein